MNKENLVLLGLYFFFILLATPLHALTVSRQISLSNWLLSCRYISYNLLFLVMIGLVFQISHQSHSLESDKNFCVCLCECDPRFIDDLDLYEIITRSPTCVIRNLAHDCKTKIKGIRAWSVFLLSMFWGRFLTDKNEKIDFFCNECLTGIHKRN